MKRREADLSSLSISEVKKIWNYTFTPPPVGFMAYSLVKYSDNFTFTYLYRQINDY
jgi:hypothetical protein